MARLTAKGDIVIVEQVTGADSDPSEGEIVTAIWQYRFINLDQIPSGSKLAQGLFETASGRAVGEFRTVLSDMEFALECLEEADRLGLPDGQQLMSRALLNAAVVSYGRVFKGGVRSVRLRVDELSDPDQEHFSTTHEALLNLRDKHVAHSVNEYERAESGPLMVQTPDGMWSPRGVGFIVQRYIGLNRQTVMNAIRLIRAWLSFLRARIGHLEAIEFAEFCQSFAVTGTFKMAPGYRVADRTKAGERR